MAARAREDRVLVPPASLRRETIQSGVRRTKRGEAKGSNTGSMRGRQEESFPVCEEGPFEAVADEMPPALQLRLWAW